MNFKTSSNIFDPKEMLLLRTIRRQILFINFLLSCWTLPVTSIINKIISPL